MLNALIIDDEQNVKTVLTKSLAKYCPDVRILATADSVTMAAQKIVLLKPNLLFLNVQMPDKMGFDLLQNFENPSFKVIFVANDNQYALKAFKYAALDYLLKPIDDIELVRAVQKAKLQLAYEDRINTFIHLFDTLKVPKDRKTKIGVATQIGLELIRVEDIISCEAASGYTILHLKNNKQLISSKDLKHFSQVLKGYDFHRVHESHLVAYAFISKVLNEDGGMVLTTDGVKIPISRRHKNDFNVWLKGFL